MQAYSLCSNTDPHDYPPKDQPGRDIPSMMSRCRINVSRRALQESDSANYDDYKFHAWSELASADSRSLQVLPELKLTVQRLSTPDVGEHTENQLSKGRSNESRDIEEELILVARPMPVYIRECRKHDI